MIMIAFQTTSMRAITWKEIIMVAIIIRTIIGVRVHTVATSRISTDHHIIITLATTPFIPALIISGVIRLARAMDIALVSAFQSEDRSTGVHSIIMGMVIMTHSRMAMGTASRTALAADTAMGLTTAAAFTIM